MDKGTHHPESQEELLAWNERVASLSAALNRTRTLQSPSPASRLPVLGALIVAARLFWERVGWRWYTQPLLEQQNRFNEQTVRAVDTLGELLLYLRDELVREKEARQQMGRDLEKVHTAVTELRETCQRLPPPTYPCPGTTDFEAAYWETQARSGLLKAKEEILTRLPGEAEEDYLRRFEESGAVDARTLEPYYPPEGRVLEIGCGIGRVLKYVRARERWGIDISQGMLDWATLYLQGEENIHLVKTNGSDLAGVPSDYFDLVYSFLVLQHVNKRAGYNYMRETRNVLKPGGHFVFLLMNILCEEGFIHFERVLNSIYPLDFYTPEEVRYKLERAGLEVDEIRLEKEYIIAIGHKP